MQKSSETAPELVGCLKPDTFNAAILALKNFNSKISTDLKLRGKL